MVNKKISKMRIRMHAFDSKMLKECCEKIIRAGKDTHSTLKGPIPMPTKRRVYCVLRSPHVNKDSREHFEIRIHTKVFYISTTSLEYFFTVQMPTGVFFSIKYLN
jgi:small subunit ribosomal protein S10